MAGCNEKPSEPSSLPNQSKGSRALARSNLHTLTNASGGEFAAQRVDSSLGLLA